MTFKSDATSGFTYHPTDISLLLIVADDRSTLTSESASGSGRGDMFGPRSAGRGQHQPPSTQPSTSSPPLPTTGDALIDSLQERLQHAKRRRDNEETMMSVIDDLTSFIRRPENCRGDCDVAGRKTTRLRPDIGADHRYDRPGDYNRNRSQNIPSKRTSEFHDVTNSDTADILCVLDNQAPAANATDINSAGLDSCFDYYEQNTGLEFDQTSQNDSYSMIQPLTTERPFGCVSAGSTPYITSHVEGLDFGSASADQFHCRYPCSNNAPDAKDEIWEWLTESVSSRVLPPFQDRLTQNTCLVLDDAANKPTTDVTLPMCDANHVFCNSILLDNLQGQSTNQMSNSRETANYIGATSSRSEDVRFLGITDGFNENTSSGLTLGHTKGNKAAFLNAVTSRSLPTGTVPFDVMQNLSFHDGSVDNTRAPIRDGITGSFDHIVSEDTCVNRFSCVRQPSCFSMPADATGQDFLNEDAAEFFQTNRRYNASQTETVHSVLGTNDFTLHTGNVFKARTKPDFAEWDHVFDIASDGDLYVSNLNLACTQSSSDMTSSCISFSDTPNSICDNWYLGSWDGLLENASNTNKTVILDCPSIEHQHELVCQNVCDIDDIRWTDCRCKYDDMFMCTFDNSAGCTGNDAESATNLSDWEDICDCAATGTWPDSLPYPTLPARQFPVTGFTYTPYQRTFVGDCAYTGQTTRYLSANNGMAARGGYAPSRCDFIRADAASLVDGEDLERALLSDGSNCSCQLRHRVTSPASEPAKYDYDTDRCANEALDLLLSILEDRPTPNGDTNTY